MCRSVPCPKCQSPVAMDADGKFVCSCGTAIAPQPAAVFNLLPLALIALGVFGLILLSGKGGHFSLLMIAVGIVAEIVTKSKRR